MRIGRRRGAVDRVATRARAHEHHAHAVGAAAVDGLQIAVIERVLAHHGGDAFDDLFVGDGAVLGFVIGDALVGVGVVFAAQSHDDVRHGAAEQVGIPPRSRCFNACNFANAFVFQLRRLAAQAVRFFVIQRAHVGFGHGSRRAQNAFLAATGACAVAARRALRNCVAPSSDCATPLRASPRRRCRCKGRGISAAYRAASARKFARWSDSAFKSSVSRVMRKAS